jgi:hypothetical protein
VPRVGRSASASRSRARSLDLSPLDLGCAPIYEQLDAVDKATVVRREEHDSFGDFIGHAGAGQGCCLGGLRCEFLDLLIGQAEFAFVARGDYRAGADDVDANVSAFEIH